MSLYLVRLFSDEVKYSERTPIKIGGTAEHIRIGAPGVESYESGQGGREWLSQKANSFMN